MTEAKTAPANQSPQLGEFVPGEGFYAGISPETNGPMYIADHDFSVNVTQADAHYSAIMHREQGKKDWHVPTDGELKQIFNCVAEKKISWLLNETYISANTEHMTLKEFERIFYPDDGSQFHDLALAKLYQGAGQFLPVYYYLSRNGGGELAYTKGFVMPAGKCAARFVRTP